ncbi:hypothetical protein [Salinibacter ruber]|uniref:Uncharacterized protein n=1 Tax=Salinibacter ruber TaxID=146919 RepID=A0AAW5P7N3_9BACT|nr:hypothetical protein [Salinibacter ruber]MCS4157807.1 hypothetical protein [Salinibacter ruber]
MANSDKKEILNALGQMAQAAEAADTASSNNSQGSILEQLLDEVKRLNDNIEEEKEAQKGRAEHFLDEFDRLEKKYEESTFTSLSADQRMEKARGIAPRVRVSREVTEDDMRVLADLAEELS